MIDYAALYASLYSRCATHADGAAVRALLGGASSLFSYHEMGDLAGRALPYLVWEPGATAGAGGDQRVIFARWTAYAAPNKGPRPLHQIAAALETLYGYTNRLAISGGELVSNGPGQVFFSEALGLYGLIYVCSFLQRG